MQGSGRLNHILPSSEEEHSKMLSTVGAFHPTGSLLEALTSNIEGQCITDLPINILNSILVRITDPVDVASVASSCSLFRTLSMTVPYKLKLSPLRMEKLAGDGAPDESVHLKNNLMVMKARTRGALAAIRHRMSATRLLDLSGCWILDEDVTALLADLRSLEFLILDNCQKLTSAVVDALAVSVRSGPRALSLQRCFGIGPAAAGNLLAAVEADNSRLQCVLLSHLDRLELPRDLEADGEPLLSTPLDGTPSCLLNSVFKPSMGIGLQVLALHNCGNLGMPELAAISMACNNLEFLLLGGSMEGLGLCTYGILLQDKITTAVSCLVEVVMSLRHLLVLEITFFPPSVSQGVREQSKRACDVWDFCNDESVSAAVEFLRNCKLCNPWQRLLDEWCCKSASKFLCISDRKAYDWRTDSEKKLFAESVFLAFSAAANCSDLRRRSPLHVAATSGNAHLVKGLLTIGARASGTRDSGGATALFVAAEWGFTDVCELLLRNGADVLSKNTAGESPIYIAALRGHAATLQILLFHCIAERIEWQSAKVYGDGWTPLMAATVANRQEVAEAVLKAATLEVDSQPLEANFQNHVPLKILDAQNRYGQTALHIAAKKASTWFVTKLLQAGASVSVRDEYGLRAVDIAQAQHYPLITKILRNSGIDQKAYEHRNVSALKSAMTCNNSSSSNNNNNETSLHHGPANAHNGRNGKLQRVVSQGSSTGVSSGNSRRVWRVRGDFSKVHPCINNNNNINNPTG